MFTKKFWVDALERAISTAAQFALGVIGLSDSAIGVINQNASLELVAAAAGTGFVLSILKALAATTFGSETSASLVE